MIRLSDTHRAVLVQTVPAVANLAVGAVVFGQFLRPQPFSITLASSGIAVWFALIGITFVLAEGRR
jgi:hypothetical protein